MVCDRCKRTVEAALKNNGIPYQDLKLGEVSLSNPLSESQKNALSNDLKKEGFELLEDRENRMLNQIKTEVINFVHYPEKIGDKNLSEYLSEKLHKEYSSLSKLFSQTEGRTIEHFFIEQRIEKVKELLFYDELSLSQIADRLHFSSLAHLSGQFKKITGMSPSEFKKQGGKRRPLDEV